MNYPPRLVDVCVIGPDTHGYLEKKKNKVKDLMIS